MNRKHAQNRSNKKRRRQEPIRRKVRFTVYTGIAVAAWILLNLSYLLNASDFTPPGMRSEYFFPFNSTPMQGIWAYDITEFVGYALLLPALLIFILRNAFRKGTEMLRRKISLTAIVMPCILGSLMAMRIDDYYLRMSYYNIMQMLSAAVLIIVLLELLYGRIMGPGR